MPDGTVKTGVIESTIGRFIFNEIIPQDLGFVDRSIPENELKLEVDFHVAKKQLKQILEKVINVHGEMCIRDRPICCLKRTGKMFPVTAHRLVRS